MNDRAGMDPLSRILGALEQQTRTMDATILRQASAYDLDKKTDELARRELEDRIIVLEAGQGEMKRGLGELRDRNTKLRDDVMPSIDDYNAKKNKIIGGLFAVGGVGAILGYLFDRALSWFFTKH